MLTHDLLQALQGRLASERTKLIAEISALQSQGTDAQEQYDAESSGYGNHIAEAASEIFEQERNMSFELNLESMLRQVERALQGIEGGTYGRCEVCTREIPVERLVALPQATLCVACKAGLEHAH